METKPFACFLVCPRFDCSKLWSYLERIAVKIHVSAADECVSTFELAEKAQSGLDLPPTALSRLIAAAVLLNGSFDKVYSVVMKGVMFAGGSPALVVSGVCPRLRVPREARSINVFGARYNGTSESLSGSKALLAAPSIGKSGSLVGCAMSLARPGCVSMVTGPLRACSKRCGVLCWAQAACIMEAGCVC